MNNSMPSQEQPSAHRTYGNFSDPFGLVLRMLASGNRAAYGALLRAGLSLGIAPLDRLLQTRERQLLAAADPDRYTHPLLLIVGPPRSGSTLLYQVLARHLNTSYLSNLTALFPRSPITATRLLHGLRQPGSSEFQSFYGQTAGLGAPNDGFGIWNRWLGCDRYETPESLSSRSADDMRRFFVAWTRQFDRPFLNKNNRNTHCLSLLAETLIAAVFVVIRRDPMYVAQSLIEARLRVQGAKDRTWGLASTNRHAAAHEPLGYVDDVCDQILTIEGRLSQQICTVEEPRIIDVTYEDFCRNPRTVVERIVASAPGLMWRDSASMASLEPFAASSSMRLTDAERYRIEQRFAGSPTIAAASHEVQLV